MSDNFKDEGSRSGHSGGGGVSGLQDDESVSSSSGGMEESSSKSSGIGTSSNPDRSTTNTSTDNDGEGRTAIAKDETAAVFRLRVIVIIVLIITASVVSAVVLSITQRGEMDELETQYEGSAYIVQVAFQDIMEDLSILSALAVVDDEFAVADDYDLEAKESNNNNRQPTTTTTTTSLKGFPFQTLDNFNKRAANARYMTGALSISMCPIVTIDKRELWEEYVLQPENNHWISSAVEYQGRMGLNEFETNEQHIEMSYVTNSTVVDPIKYFDQTGQAHLSLNDGPYLPVWQTSPVLSRRIVNENTFSRTIERQAGLAVNAISTQQAILGGFLTAQYGDPSNPNPTTSLFATYRSIKEENSTRYLGDPLSYFYLPIFDYNPDHHQNHPSSSSTPTTTTTKTSDNDTYPIATTTTTTTSSSSSRVVVGVLQSLIEWRGYFRNILKDDIPPIIVILENSCGGQYTYELQGQEAYIVGPGDHHDPALDQWEISSTFTTNHLRDGTVEGIYVNQQHGCQYSVRIYPTQQFMDKYNTDTPLAITFAIAVVFVFTICMFILYDRLVEQRQNIVMAQAAHTTAIVSSLFPKNVRDRLLAPADLRRTGGGSIFSVNKSRLKGFLDDGDSQGENDSDDAPIADLFPECTVFFADIAGFTAWSSTREPEQVFVLLQTVYQKFDILAKRRRVFKVETIGDSYMAVTGLPEPMVNHAVTMVRFAWDCRNEFHRVTKELECQLGPDTADLAMRFGLHSGPVTAGVLRGDRARFQLFGDTVNTASRMESTGMRDRVQLSGSTAELVRLAGKETWLRQREDEVHAKGKGSLVTYWATPKTSLPSSTGGSSQDGLEDSPSQVELRPQPSHSRVNQRLVDWMTDLLLDQTKKIVYSRRKNKGKPSDEAPKYFPQEGMTCMDEVKEQIEMPTYDAQSTDTTGREYRNVRINSEVVANLREYVSRIAETYRNNAFHNFEHACHVTMSVNKLLKRIVAPDLSHEEIERLQKMDDMAAHLHDYTHGINGDPLLAFAITISALIHDVDHRGVSNTRLIEEEPEMASKYHDKSVAEQNSLDIAWAILMEDGFEQLRRVLFPTHFDLMRFRQLIVNVVLATDIMDKELNGLRKRRWERAFSEESKEENTNDTNLRATIVIEHIIQASDVSHTMQHWHVYRKWNERLFQEVYKAYLDGRMEKDPSEGWYKGEIGFFDFYIIPLAKKLKECGVFGVSSDEYLSYAEQNRKEWELKGAEIVAGMLEKVKR